MNENRRVFVFIGILVLALVVCTTGAFAGTTGKIVGRVTGADGEPLPGASVVIEGTQRGAITDADGYYVIVSVDPEAYALTASLVGYTNVTKRSVNVAVDYTSKIDFTLKEKAIEAAEIVVTAERPPVEVDKTSTRYLVSADEIKQLPVVKTTTEFISLQPGVDQAGTFSIRGGDITDGRAPRGQTSSDRGTDAVVLIDGVRVTGKDGHGAVLFAGVNKSAVQQISIETGVMPAEYGDAQAGTISIVTQDGGRDYHGWTEVNFEPAGKKHWGSNVYDSPIHLDHMRWDDPEWLAETDSKTGRIIHVRENYTGWSGYTAEGSLTGPIGPKASFLVSARHAHRAARIPSPESHGFYDDRGGYINAPNNIQGSASLTLRPADNIKVKAGMILHRYTAWNMETTRRLGGTGRGMSGNGRNIFLPTNWSYTGQYRHTDNLGYVTFTHTLSPKTFYEVRFGRSATLQDTLNAHLVTANPRRDRDGWFNLDGQIGSWVNSDRKRWSFKVDLASQISRGHFIKTGIELIRYDAWYIFWLMRSKSEVWLHHYSGGDKPWALKSPAHPIRAAYYVQDKMEFQGLIVNLGVRVDFQIHRHEEPIDAAVNYAPMWRTFTNRHFLYGEGSASGVDVSGGLVDKAPTQVVFSPRLGISHPVTDRMKIHFSLGRFIQWPDLFNIYSKSYRNYGSIASNGLPWRDVNGNGEMDSTEFLNATETKYSGLDGWTRARPEETLTFEVGADWNFVADYTAGMVVFYRSETQQHTYQSNQRWEGPKRGRRYVRETTNGVGGYAKGFEVSVGKRLSTYFSFRAGWASMWTANGRMGLGQAGQRLYPGVSFITSPEFWYAFTPNADGSETPVPLTEAEKVEFSADAARVVRSAVDPDRFLTQSWPKNEAPAPNGRDFWYVGRFGDVGDREFYTDYRNHAGTARGPLGGRGGEKVGGRIGQANVQFVLNTPSNVQLGPRVTSWLVSDLQANMLWRLRTGRRFTWRPTGGQQKVGKGPINTRVDLSVEKTFNTKGRVRPSFFVEARNLFNQADDEDNATNSRGVNYMRFGLTDPNPDDKNLLNYGDLTEASKVYEPRQTHFGIRVIF